MLDRTYESLGLVLPRMFTGNFTGLGWMLFYPMSLQQNETMGD